MKDPTPININGVMCYHVKQFAALTNRTTQSVYGLIVRVTQYVSYG